MRDRSTGRIAGCAAVVLLLLLHQGAQAARYSIQALGTFGGPDSVAYHLNQSGSATGAADTPELGSFGFPETNAFASGPSGLLRLRPPDGFSGSLGRDINEQGVVAGAASQGNRIVPVVWRSGDPVIIPLPDGYSGQAEALNNTGLVVGVAFPDQTSSFSAFVFDGLRTTLIGNSWAWDVNDAGIVAGWSDGLAAVYTDGAWTPIPSISGAALGINRRGDMVGYEFPGGVGSQQAVLMSAQGSPVSIPLLPGTTWSLADDINDAGVSVGYAMGERALGGPDTMSARAFIFDPNTGVEDLNDLIAPGSGWTLLRQARGINNAGQISGMGFFNGHERGFLLTPVPEPGTWGMLLAGATLIWAVGVARRR